MKTWLLKRLKEPSTWAGLMAVTTAVGGFSVPDELRDAIIAVGTSVVGLLLVLIKEHDPAQTPPPRVLEVHTPPPPSSGTAPVSPPKVGDAIPGSGVKWTPPSGGPPRTIHPTGLGPADSDESGPSN